MLQDFFKLCVAKITEDIFKIKCCSYMLVAKYSCLTSLKGQLYTDITITIINIIIMLVLVVKVVVVVVVVVAV